jgi:lipoteichoic acid synthase
MQQRLGPAIFCAVVGVSRAVWLSMQLSGLDAVEIGYLLLADVPVVGALGLLAYAEPVLARGWRRFVAALAMVVMVFYVADVMAVVTLNSRLQLSDARRFATEIWVARSFLSLLTVTVLVAAAGSFALTLPVPQRAARFVATTSLVFVLLPFVIAEERVPAHLRKYAGSILRLPAEVWAGRRLPASDYGPGDVAAFRASYDALFDAPIARSRKNIILVIVESLSAADSARTAGIRNVLPRFDELSRRGMLFRNFFANYEASEGGLVALLSGVPPLHFPRASTQPFEEYAVQRSIVDALRREGYRCEFLTSVPLRFLSMNAYVTSARSGFDRAGGQQEIERFRDAPRFSFESAADHVLFEELLSRLDARAPHGPSPVFMAVVTATSHPPYIDPRGGGNSEARVWAYVQDELWWLHDELAKRRFFDNGLLVITGDHRRMQPVRRDEQARYGESAKARVPLAVIGAGVPEETLDDRLFQQSDLLRMLDRALQPSQALSPFVLWVNRYLAGLGFAANAANVDVFVESNQAKEPFPLKLRGAEIEWLQRPPEALSVERAIHQQRAMQQAMRVASVPSTALNFGRNLEPSNHVPGVLVGFSKDLDLSRDPDDPRGSLKIVTTDSFDQDRILPLVSGDAPYTLSARAFLPVPADGEYWFTVYGDDEICVAIDQRVVLGCQRKFNPGLALLTAGLHRFDLRFVARNSRQRFELKWLRPGEKAFEPFPQQSLVLPQANSQSQH